MVVTPITAVRVIPKITYKLVSLRREPDFVAVLNTFKYQVMQSFASNL